MFLRVIAASFILIVLGESSANAKPSAASDAEFTAESAQLVDAAEQAGARGDAGERRALLERAIRTAPDYAPARWAAGQVRADDGWMHVSIAQSAAAADPRLVEYRDRREAVEDGRDHAALARWCDRQGLADEARLNWLEVLDSEPDNREALGQLGLVRVNGRLTTREAVRDEGSLRREASRRGRYWERRIAHWERSRSPRGGRTDSVLDEVRAIDDRHAGPAFERLAERLADDEHPRFERRRQLCAAFVEALHEMDGPEATASLVRHAVLTPHAGLRSQAIDALADRPKIEAVPLLLAGLRPTADSEYEVRVAPNGEVAYEHLVSAEGRDADYEFRRTRNASIVSLPGPIPTFATLRGAFLPADGTAVDRVTRSVWERRVASARSQVAFARQAQELETQVAALNESAESVNARITPVLERVTGQRIGPDPGAWWAYWQEYQGYQRYDERPTFREYDHAEDVSYITAPVAPRPRCECFVAGTPVWTKTGRAPIESIEAGDFVLAKDADTGELGFRAVLATTVRRPSPMITVTVGDERFVATSGHPFWVVDRGWRMAKELSTGDLLSTVDGPAAIAAIEPAEDAEAFNLIVEGVATYFVGGRGLLVHDNTPRDRIADVARR